MGSHANRHGPSTLTRPNSRQWHLARHVNSYTHTHKDHIRRAATISYTCCSLCLTIFGLAWSRPLFLDPMIRNPWLTLNSSMAMHFLIRITRGAQRYLSLIERGKSHLDRLCLTACFLTGPKATFITTLLWCSVWWLLSKSVHILSTYDDLRS